MNQICFGVDIGGTAVKLGMFDRGGNLLKKWEFRTIKSEDGRALFQSIADYIKDIIQRNNISLETIIGVGVGVPGPVKENGYVHILPNLGLSKFNIEEELHKLLGLKVKAGNDANNAALGEQWMGSGKGSHSMIMVTLGTGVGGGVIINDTVLVGNNGVAGEIGHILVNDTETEHCGCGKSGCLEQYSSATGIVRMAKAYLDSSDEASQMRSHQNLNAKDVFDCAKAGDLLALKVVEDACCYLGKALAQVAQVIDPEVFVIGGGVSKAGDIITKTTQKYYNTMVMDALKNKEFRLAMLGNDAGIYGAAKLVIA